MKPLYLLFTAIVLSGCTRSCAKTQSPKESPTEHWSLQIQNLNSGTTELNQAAAAELVLTGESITLIQPQKTLTLKVLAWDKPDFAKVTYGNEIGYFKWDVVGGQKRFEQRPYKCQDIENAPMAMTQVEETEQVKTVAVHLENADSRVVTFHMDAAVPQQTFWVQTGAVPVTQCPRPQTPSTLHK